MAQPVWTIDTSSIIAVRRLPVDGYKKAAIFRRMGALVEAGRLVFPEDLPRINSIPNHFGRLTRRLKAQHFREGFPGGLPRLDSTVLELADGSSRHRSMWVPPCLTPERLTALPVLSDWLVGLMNSPDGF